MVRWGFLVWLLVHGAVMYTAFDTNELVVLPEPVASERENDKIPMVSDDETLD
jgi:hypothetical protein